MDDSWASINPTAITGFSGSPVDGGSGGLTSGLETAVTTAAGANPPPWSPDNPLFWVTGVLAAAVGAIYVSTTVKVGPLRDKTSI